MYWKDDKSHGLEYIYYDEEVYGIILRNEFEASVISFFTPDSFSQQLGYLPHKKGNVIQPHIHKEHTREVHLTNEALFLKKGEVKINFYNHCKEFIGSEIIYSGDMILLCSGGHGLEILEDSVMIEIKQGPYMGLDDKERFKGIES